MVLLLLPQITVAIAPGVLDYQGRVNSGGVPFHGTGEFMFAIMDQTEFPVWTSDEMYPPVTPLEIPVTNGLFNIKLGGETGMPPIPVNALNSEFRYLRI